MTHFARLLPSPSSGPKLTALTFTVLWLGSWSCLPDGAGDPPPSADASAGHSGASGAGGSAGTGGTGGAAGASGAGGQAGTAGDGGSGGGVPCTYGIAESTEARCSDGCDNDNSGIADCADINCCALRSDCGPTTYCGKQSDGNAWDGYVDIDDAELQALDPSKLPSGMRPCHAPSLVRVNYAVDGDTLDVTDELGGDAGGRVRVIGVDTPEVDHGSTPADCYGDEAEAFTSQLAGHLVWLTFDAECRDAYDRLLAYVHIGPGKQDSLERQLLRRGLARAYPYGDNRTFEQLFAADELEAQAGQSGLWGACL